MIASFSLSVTRRLVDFCGKILSVKFYFTVLTVKFYFAVLTVNVIYSILFQQVVIIFEIYIVIAVLS